MAESTGTRLTGFGEVFVCFGVSSSGSAGLLATLGLLLLFGITSSISAGLLAILGLLFGRGASAGPRGVSMVSGCSFFGDFGDSAFFGDLGVSGTTLGSVVAFLALRLADFGTMYLYPRGSGFPAGTSSGPSSGGAWSSWILELGLGVLVLDLPRTTDDGPRVLWASAE